MLTKLYFLTRDTANVMIIIYRVLTRDTANAMTLIYRVLIRDTASVTSVHQMTRVELTVVPLYELAAHVWLFPALKVLYILMASRKYVIRRPSNCQHTRQLHNQLDDCITLNYSQGDNVMSIKLIINKLILKFI